MSCAKCRFWQQAPETDMGKCRVKPPQAILIPAQDALGQSRLQVATFWPETLAEDWCGDCDVSLLQQARDHMGEDAP